MRRVVITGMGILSPLGSTIQKNQNNLFNGVSGISKITSFDTTDYASKIAGQIAWGQDEGQFNPDSFMPPKEQRHIDKFVLYGIYAGVQALQDAGFEPKTEEEKNRAGVVFGSGIGGLTTICETADTLRESGPHRVSPFFIPSAIINMIAGHISIKKGLQGPSTCIATACSTGSHCIGEAARIIRSNDADVMVAGGSESAVIPMAVAGFAQARALSTHYNETPKEASRPWDKDRDGFIIGEGAGAVVLEEYEHAKARGAKIYGELVGYGASSDAYHITAPGNGGALRAMKNALHQAGLNAADIGYVNAHGTSTGTGDIVELNAVKELYGADIDKLSMSSTKSMTGHLLGAAGAVEAIYSLMALNEGILPPTLNLKNPIEEAANVDLVPFKAKEKKIQYALSNSFGFGGTNASLIFAKV